MAERDATRIRYSMTQSQVDDDNDDGDNNINKNGCVTYDHLHSLWLDGSVLRRQQHYSESGNDDGHDEDDDSSHRGMTTTATTTTTTATARETTDTLTTSENGETILLHHRDMEDVWRRTTTCCEGVLGARCVLVICIVLMLNFFIMIGSRGVTSFRKFDNHADSSINANSHSNNNNHYNSYNLSGLLQWAPLPPTDQTLTRIAFGSCSSQLMPQPYWDTLAVDYQPDLVLLMGDNVYGDCHDAVTPSPQNYTSAADPTSSSSSSPSSSPLSTVVVQPNCSTLRQAYADWAAHPSLIGAASRLAIFATLDDHDYGQDDAHAGNPYRDVAVQLFQDFFHISTQELPAYSKDSMQDGDSDGGVYRARAWGPPGRRVQVILLDTRYSRSPFLETGVSQAPFQPYANDDDLNNTTNSNNKNNGARPPPIQMLSRAQWTWLQDTVLSEPADLRIVVSSIQLLSATTPFECWRMIPWERARFLDLFHNESIIIVSGDRHVGGIYSNQYIINNTNTSSSTAAPLNVMYEVTASSWTHTLPLGAHGQNCTTAATCDEIDPARVHTEWIRVNHFGTLDIDWDNRMVLLSLRRAATSYGMPYVDTTNPYNQSGKYSHAGEILQSIEYHF